MTKKQYIKINEVWTPEVVKEKLRENYNIDNKKGDFNWIIKEDLDYFKKDIPASARFGIPNQVIGDYENALVYICLLNPGTHLDNEKSKNILSVGEYIEKESAAESKINTIGNNEYLKYDLKEIDEKYKWYYKHIINKSDNIVLLEFMNLFKRYLQNNKEITTVDVKNIAYYSYVYFSGIFKIKNSSETGVSQLTGFLNELFDEYSDKPTSELESYLRSIRVCNLELLPYRSQNFKQIKFTNGLENLSTSKFIASIILNRIFSYELNEIKVETERPIFLLRSFETWINVINNFIESEKENFDAAIINLIKETKSIEEFIGKYIYPYIYAFSSSQKPSISPNNILEPNGYLIKSKIIKELNVENNTQKEIIEEKVKEFKTPVASIKLHDMLVKK